jgi:hypothetical protein
MTEANQEKRRAEVRSKEGSRASKQKKQKKSSEDQNPFTFISTNYLI